MNFTKIHHDVRIALKVKPFHYFVIDSIYNCQQKYGSCEMSKKKMASNLGVTERTIKTIFAELKFWGILEINGYNDVCLTELAVEIFKLVKEERISDALKRVKKLPNLGKKLPKRNREETSQKEGKDFPKKSEETSLTPYNNKEHTKEKEETPPPQTSNSEKPNKSDDAKNATTEKPNPQKFAPSKEQLMYAIMASMDETHIGRMDASERKNLEKLFYKIRNHLEDIKKNVQKMPSWNVAQHEVIASFKDFCNGLSDFIKRERFTTAYLNRHYADLRKEAMQKNRKPAKQEIKEENYYQPKKKRK